MDYKKFATWWEAHQKSGSSKQSKGKYSPLALKRALTLFRDWALWAKGSNAYPFPGTLMEIGCCDGQFLLAAKRKGWATDVVGLTHSKVELELTQANGLHCYYTSVNEMSGHKDGSVDVIFARRVVEHLPFLAHGVSEMCRVARVGVIISTPVLNAKTIQDSAHLIVPTKLQMIKLAKLFGREHLVKRVGGDLRTFILV
jgi:2-polyprenyl-3-methyl-5-hydroxy-6-metoxy-1,4-benzoquinol methylase